MTILVLPSGFGRGPHDLGSQAPQYRFLLLRHLARQGDDTPVPLQPCHQSQADPRVSRGRLDDDRPGMEETLAFGRLDHSFRYPVFDGSSGREELDLGHCAGSSQVGSVRVMDRADSLGRGLTHECYIGYLEIVLIVEG